MANILTCGYPELDVADLAWFSRPQASGRRCVARSAWSVRDRRLSGALGGADPHIALEEWSFTIGGDVDEPVSWTWQEFLTLPWETPTVDIHCVTKWTKLDTRWKSVSVDTLLAAVNSEAPYLTAWSDGGYTTNLALEDVTDGKAWVAYEFGGEPLSPSTAGPRGCWSRTCTSGRARSGYVELP